MTNKLNFHTLKSNFISMLPGLVVQAKAAISSNSSKCYSFHSLQNPILWEQGELKIHLKSGFLFKLAEAVPMAD
ncbi:hypothetical protein, partial [Oceanobacillus oncorhynchi]|uniref:hypothetical protein n=1 Tax=Oceanobacillus oncorhynchi TaxID=545501 RepID=UPI001D001AAD